MIRFNLILKCNYKIQLHTLTQAKLLPYAYHKLSSTLAHKTKNSPLIPLYNQVNTSQTNSTPTHPYRRAQSQGRSVHR